MTDTIIMIHGMWGGGWYWENYVRFFREKGYRCIAPTLRFHEAGPDAVPHPLLGTTSLLDYADDLEREIDSLATTPILIGHSMGGLLAQILGSRGRAKAVVLLSSAAPSGIVSLSPSVLRSFWSAFAKWGFWRKPHRQTFREAAYSVLNLMPPDQQKEIHGKYVHESGRAAVEIGLWFLDPRKAASVDALKLSCPVLVLAGSEDKIVPAFVGRKIAEKYQAVSTYREYAHHAHWLFGEPGWEKIAGQTADWLDRVGVRR